MALPVLAIAGLLVVALLVLWSGTALAGSLGAWTWIVIAGVVLWWLPSKQYRPRRR